MVRELTSKVFRKSPMSAGATGELPRPRERRAGVGDQRPLTRVVVIANIYAPYRVPTLRELGRSVDLRILFSAATEPNRDWAVPDRMPFRSEVIGGRVVGRGRSEPLYVSLKLFRRLRALNPDVVIVGGYSMPAVYAAFYCRLRGRPLILWSEGTPASESALGGHQNVARSVLTRAASGAVAASTDARDRFAELGVPMDRIFVAPYALDVGERPYRHFDKTAPVQLLFVAQLIRGRACRDCCGRLRCRVFRNCTSLSLDRDRIVTPLKPWRDRSTSENESGSLDSSPRRTFPPSMQDTTCSSSRRSKTRSEW